MYVLYNKNVKCNVEVAMKYPHALCKYNTSRVS